MNGNFERLSGDYVRGYTKALMDLQEVFSYIKDDLRYHKKLMTATTAEAIIACCLKNREALREDLDGFIRYNDKVKGKFEFYSPKKDKQQNN